MLEENKRYYLQLSFAHLHTKLFRFLDSDPASTAECDSLIAEGKELIEEYEKLCARDRFYKPATSNWSWLDSLSRLTQT